MNATLDTPYFALVKADGKLVINSIERDCERLRLRLADRIANGEAFPGEHVVRVGLAIQWFSGLQTCGEETIPCFFVPMYPEDLQAEIDRLKPCLDDSCEGGHCSVCGGHFIDHLGTRATHAMHPHCEALPRDQQKILADRARAMFNALHPCKKELPRQQTESDIDRGERETLPP